MYNQSEKNIKRQSFKYPLAVAAIVVIGIGVGFILWSNSSNTGQIEEVKSQAPVHVAPYKTYQGKYFSFQYKSSYQAQALPARDNDLELASLEANTNYAKLLAVSLSLLPDGKLGNNSAYSFRHSDTAEYSLHNQTVSGGQAMVFVKTDGSDQTVFIPRGGKVAVLSFSTAGNADDLNSEVPAVLNSFKWDSL